MHRRLVSAFLLLFSAAVYSDVSKAVQKPMPITGSNVLVHQGFPKSFNAVYDSTNYKIRIDKQGFTTTFTSTDKSLAKIGFEKSKTVVDFSGNKRIVVISIGNGRKAVCYFKEIDTSGFNSVLRSIILGEDIAFDSTLVLDGRGKPKNKNEVKKFMKKYMSAKSTCRSASLIEVSELSADADLTDSKNNTLLGYNSVISIVTKNNVNTKGNNGKGNAGKGNGGKGNGGKGNGGKGNGGKGNVGKGRIIQTIEIIGKNDAGTKAIGTGSGGLSSNNSNGGGNSKKGKGKTKKGNGGKGKPKNKKPVSVKRNGKKSKKRNGKGTDGASGVATTTTTHAPVISG